MAAEASVEPSSFAEIYRLSNSNRKKNKVSLLMRYFWTCVLPLAQLPPHPFSFLLFRSYFLSISFSFFLSYSLSLTHPGLFLFPLHFFFEFVRLT